MTKKIKYPAVIIAVLILVLVVAGYETVEMQSNQKQGLIRVACVGDSITQGSEYPDALWMLLGRNYTVGTFGHGGTTVSLNATAYMLEQEFQEAKAFKPNIVIIMLGTNDAFPGFEQYIGFFVDDYLTLIGEFQALQSKPQVWLVLPPPVWHNGTGLSTEFYEQTVIPHIQQVANKTGLPLINVHDAVVNHPEFFPDGVHPDSEGSKMIADAIYKALTQNSST